MADRRPDHERAQELAAAALDFELARDEREWLAAHLEGCPSCRRMSLMYQADARAIERLPDASAPDRVRLRVLDAVHGRRRREPFPMLALAGAGALAIVIVAVVLLRPLDEDLPPTGAQSPSSPPSATATVTASPSAPSSPSPTAPPITPPPGPVALDWQSAEVPGGDTARQLRGIAVGRDLVLASLSGAGEVPIIWSSGRGLGWRDASVPETTFGGRPPFLLVEYGQGFVALGWTDVSRTEDERRIWLSADGLSWRPAEHPSGILGSFNYGVIAAGADRLVVAGRASAGETLMWSSADGIEWLPQDTGDAFSDAALTGLASDGSSFYAFGTRAGAGGIWQSADGATWTSLPAPPESASISGLAATPAGLLARGSTPANKSIADTAWWSPDGQTWERVAMPPLPTTTGDRITRIVETDTGLLAIWSVSVEASVRAARSTDGRTWEFLDLRGFPSGVIIDQIDQIDSVLVAFGHDRTDRVVAFWADAPN